MINMMIGPALIYASTHSIAEDHVSQRNHKEYNRNRKKDHVLHRKFPSVRGSGFESDLLSVILCTTLAGWTPLKFDHDGHVDELFIAA
jgi:hypothetical protein